MADIDDAVDIPAFTAWLTAAADATRATIALPEHELAAATAIAIAAAADATATTATADHQQAADRAGAMQEAFDGHARVVQDEDEQDGLRHLDAVNRRDTETRRAQNELAEAADHVTRTRDVVSHAEREFHGLVTTWQNRLVYLQPADIEVPRPDGIDQLSLRGVAERAYHAAERRLQLRRGVAEREHADAAATLAGMESERADARRAAPLPPAPRWRPERSDDATPLWALVGFADDVPPDIADQLEGALLVSGVLDALVRPDGRLTAGDLVITADNPAAGATLADFLRPEAHPDIDAAVIDNVLRAISVDAAPGVTEFGPLRVGVLTATAPHGYQAAFIGQTARERARQERVAELDAAVATAEAHLAATGQNLAAAERDLAAAADELASFPPAAELGTARTLHAAAAAEHHMAELLTAAQIAQAQLVYQNDVTAINAVRTERHTRLAAVEQDLRHLRAVEADLATVATAAVAKSADLEATAQRLTERRDLAATASREAQTDVNGFPPHENVLDAQRAEADAVSRVNRARARTIDAVARHDTASAGVRTTLRDLNRAAAPADGPQLPTHRDGLTRHAEAITQLGGLVDSWCNAAQRAIELRRRATDAARDASKLGARAASATQDAATARTQANEATAAVAEASALYGAAYEELHTALQAIVEELETRKAHLGDIEQAEKAARDKEIEATTLLAGLAPQRQASDARRNHHLQQLARLVDERFVTVPDDIATDDTGRPAHITAGLAWAHRILDGQLATPDRLAALTTQRDRALTALDVSARDASAALIRFNRQVAITGIEGTPWRRAVVADPETARGHDLCHVLETLHATVAQLQEDLREDIKQIFRMSMFTQLQRDVQIHREAAQQLVRDIRATLAGIRTGVERVGVQVEWDVRDDDDAQRMVDLITSAPSDATFEQMYTVLRQRMDETIGLPWDQRVAHAFDYRAWHVWKIAVTHNSFGNGTEEVFRDVNARANPLESLSTGERRLATMLPLLAAAWSMYSHTGYLGPRLLSIDEIDAAFDDDNLRHVLRLLRSWNFDVLATAPFMTPLIKQEAGQVVVHEVVKSGKYRVTVPWLWEGHGEPQPLTLDFMINP